MRNAYAHTPAGGTISVRTHESRRGEIEIEIVNTGSYIPPERRERIFQPFVSGRANGTGLGLAIAKQIAHAHGGSLGVESSEAGVTGFVLRLPVAGEDAAIPMLQPQPQPSLAAGAA